MTITDSRVTEVSEFDAQLLFEEARRRRHRRWFIGTVLVFALALAAALLVSFDSRTPRSSPQPHVGLPRWTPSQGSLHAAPALFVAGDGKGGVGVYSTVTGSLIRSISPQGQGGPDQQIVLSDNRESVFFVQPTGPCSGNILSGLVSGAGSPTVVVSQPNTLALSPSGSPTSKELAWAGVTCGSTGSTSSSTLYITHLATGVTNDLGVFSGQQSDEGISWNSDGTRLAVESGATVAVFDTDRSTPNKVASLVVTRGCTLASPTFLSSPNQLAAIRTCFDKSGALGTSQALVFNITSSNPVAIIASAPHGSTFQGMSVDVSGQHILLGVATRFPASAENVQVEAAGRLVTVSQHAPTDAQW
jgi:hypothetical protein